MPVLMATNAAHNLVDVVENTPGTIKMPKMVMLVKQLKKELNITKSMKEEHRRVGKLLIKLLYQHFQDLVVPNIEQINIFYFRHFIVCMKELIRLQKFCSVCMSHIAINIVV